jgi:hypothetical protein
MIPKLFVRKLEAEEDRRTADGFIKHRKAYGTGQQHTEALN